MSLCLVFFFIQVTDNFTKHHKKGAKHKNRHELSDNNIFFDIAKWFTRFFYGCLFTHKIWCKCLSIWSHFNQLFLLLLPMKSKWFFFSSVVFSTSDACFRHKKCTQFSACQFIWVIFKVMKSDNSCSMKENRLTSHLCNVNQLLQEICFFCVCYECAAQVFKP